MSLCDMLTATMRLSALGILLFAATYIVGAHPAWDGLSIGEQPSSVVRMKKCTACKTIGLPNAPHNGTIHGGGRRTMNHPTRQGLLASMLRNFMARDRFDRSHGPGTSPEAKITLGLEEKEEQPKFTEEKINKPFVGLTVNDTDKRAVVTQPIILSIEKKDCRILKCLTLYLALHRLQRNSSKLISFLTLIGTISRTKDKGFQNIDDIMKQIKIYCKYPQTAIKDTIHKLIGARIHSKNVSEVAPELGRHEDVNVTSLHENSIRSNAKQEMHISALKPIETTQPDINDKINMKSSSTHAIIPSIPATITPQISENLLLGSTETTGNWVSYDTVNDELDRVTSSSYADNPHLQPTTDGNNDFQTSHTDFVDVNAYRELGTVTQGSNSTTDKPYIHPKIDGNKDFNTTFTEFKPMNVTAGRLLKILPRRILFLYKGHTIPMMLVRTESGTTDIAIDGDYVCNRTINDPLRYETKFSKFCYNN